MVMEVMASMKMGAASEAASEAAALMPRTTLSTMVWPPGSLLMLRVMTCASS